MNHLPSYIAATFGITVLLSLWLFIRATRYSRPFSIFLISLVLIQSVAGLSGFYSGGGYPLNVRIPALVLPLMATCTLLFFTPKGRMFIDSLDVKTLTLFHIIRIPVEIVLYWLFIQKAVPEAMTFEGRNWDIVSGVSAPLVYYFGFISKKLSRTAIIVWNGACMLLLINVVSIAIRSQPERFQNFGFERPNIAVGYFPFVLLPALLVPLVIFAHAAALRQLILKIYRG